tara:strand:- start:230 stop:481 length:252 start_codon:yes stop_codon:yes gene_type:complete
MSVQRTVVEVANQAFARHNKETTVSTIDLIKMIQDGEKQLEGLYDRIKQGERQALLMEDRIQAQKDTIGRLQAEVLKLKTKRK